MRSVHATDKTWYTVLYHHTMYVSLSSISIKTNFKQIARAELKCVHYSEGDYILCMTARYFFRSFTNVRLLCFVSHSNGMTSCQSSSTENVSCNVAPFFYHHSVVICNILLPLQSFDCAYLMKGILETFRVYKIRYYVWIDVFAGVLLVPECIIFPVVRHSHSLLYILNNLKFFVGQVNQRFYAG
jgi:hypothetical protein